MHFKQNFVILVFALVLLAVFLYFRTNAEKPVIVTGTANPGRIMIYSFDGTDYKRSEIDTGYNLVWTVRTGDIYNKGKSVIVAGVGNSFFAQPFGCSLVAYELTANGWKKDVIDSNVDIRCKDIAIGDAYNDGRNQIVLSTHGQGIINIYEWDGKWNKQQIERNFIGQIDQQRSTNHRVPFENLTYDAIDQTAVHIVKIGNALNDGKNEVVATESSPLEYTGTTVSFVNIYSFDGKNWNRTTVHEGKGYQDRSILIEDFFSSGKNEIAIGANPGKLLMLQNNGASYNFVFNQSYDKNMKGLDYADAYGNGQKEIIIATGIPNSLVYLLQWDGKEFQSKIIGNITQVFEKYNVLNNLSYNSLDVKTKDLEGNGKTEIVVAGESDTSQGSTFTQGSQFGWETTPFGFLVVYRYNGSWQPYILDQGSVLGMTVGNLQI